MPGPGPRRGEDAGEQHLVILSASLWASAPRSSSLFRLSCSLNHGSNIYSTIQYLPRHFPASMTEEMVVLRGSYQRLVPVGWGLRGWGGGLCFMWQCDADASCTGTQPVLPIEDRVCKAFSDGSTRLSVNIFSRCASPFWENESHLKINLEVSMLKLCILMHAMTRGFLHPSVSSEDGRLGVRTCFSVGWVAAWIFDLCEVWQHASKDA